MRVIYFAFEGFDTKNGTNHLALKMMDEFLKSGIDVYLITSHSQGVFEDIPPLLKNRKGFTYDIIDRSIVSKRNFIQRYWDGLKYSLNCMKAWKKEISTVDVIILQSTPTVVFSSILLALFGKKPVIFKSYDVFPDGPYAMGVINNKFVFKGLQFLQKIVYKTSEKIVVISPDMKTQLIKIGVPAAKLVEVKNWYDNESIKYVPFNENMFAERYNLSEDIFYVQYAGNFGYTFNYKMVIDIAERLKSNDRISFQMIGDGAFKDDFVKEAQKRGIDNITFYPWQPLEIINDVYSLCSVQLIPLTEGVIWNSFPSKGSIIMACGRVVICTTDENSEYYRELNENEIGICVPDNSPEDAAKAITTLFEDREKLEKIGRKARDYATTVYSSAVNIDKLIALLYEVHNNNKKRRGR